jgi:hypothetical protein
MLTDEDFDTLIIMIKSLRRTLLEESKILCKCSRCGNVYYSKPKFCSNCGLDLGVDSEKFPDQIWDFFGTLGTHCGLIDRKFGASMAIYKSD